MEYSLYCRVVSNETCFSIAGAVSASKNDKGGTGFEDCLALDREIQGTLECLWIIQMKFGRTLFMLLSPGLFSNA